MLEQWLLKNLSMPFRGANIICEITGYGATSDGADMVAPSGEGAERCMKMAMENIGGPLDYLNTHGTSTPVGDVKELSAMKRVFGNDLPAISSTKSMTGHSLGSSGIQELIYGLLMMEAGFACESINIDELDDEAKGFPILRERTAMDMQTFMSNSFGFGGTNASLVVSKLHSA